MSIFGDNVRAQAREASPAAWSPVKAAFVKMMLRMLQRTAYRLGFHNDKNTSSWAHSFLRIIALKEKVGHDFGAEIEMEILHRVKEKP